MATTEEARLRLVLEMKDRMSKEMQQSGKAVDKLDGKLKKMRMQMVAVSAAGGALLGASVKEFVAFEKGMREVQTLLNIGEQEFQDLSKQVRAVSVEMGLNAVEATKSLYQAISSGIPKENILTFLRTSAKLSIGGVTDLETATLGLKTALNAYSVDAADSQDISDTLFETMRLGTTTIGELSSFLFQAVPTAAAFGVSLEEVAAATALVTRQGSPTSFVMRGLRAAMVALVKPTEDMQVLINQVAAANKDMESATGGAMIKTLGLQGSLQALLDAAGGSKDALTAAGLQAESLAVVFGMTGEKTAQFKEFLADITDAAGATDAAFEKMEKSLARQLERLGSEFREFKMMMGEDLAPAVRAVVAVFRELLAWIKSMPGPVRGLATALIVLTTAMASLGFVMTTVLIPGMKAMIVAIRAIWATFAAHPIGAILTGLGLILVAVATKMGAFSTKVHEATGVSRAAAFEFTKLEESMRRLQAASGLEGEELDDHAAAVQALTDKFKELRTQRTLAAQKAHGTREIWMPPDAKTVNQAWTPFVKSFAADMRKAAAKEFTELQETSFKMAMEAVKKYGLTLEDMGEAVEKAGFSLAEQNAIMNELAINTAKAGKEAEDYAAIAEKEFEKALEAAQDLIDKSDDHFEEQRRIHDELIQMDKDRFQLEQSHRDIAEKNRKDALDDERAEIQAKQDLIIDYNNTIIAAEEAQTKYAQFAAEKRLQIAEIEMKEKMELEANLAKIEELRQDQKYQELAAARQQFGIPSVGASFGQAMSAAAKDFRPGESAMHAWSRFAREQLGAGTAGVSAFTGMQGVQNRQRFETERAAEVKRRLEVSQFLGTLGQFGSSIPDLMREREAALLSPFAGVTNRRFIDFFIEQSKNAPFRMPGLIGTGQGGNDFGQGQGVGAPGTGSQIFMRSDGQIVAADWVREVALEALGEDTAQGGQKLFDMGAFGNEGS
jgi:TP901 family phage tail tape measure protein